MPRTNNNSRPRYFGEPNNKFLQGLTGSLSAVDLTGGTLDTNVYQVFNADATVDSYLREVRVKAHPINATAATIARLWLNNGSTIATAANSSFLAEMQIPATAASTTVPTPEFVLPVGRIIQATYRVLLTFSVAPGGSGAFSAQAFGNNF